MSMIVLEKNIEMKTLFALLILMSAAFSSQAQVAFGLKGGLNLSNLEVDDPQASYDSRTGYHAGFFLRSTFDKVAIQPELLLYTQSNQIDYASSSINPGTVENDFTYLTIPVLLKFCIVSGLNVHAGPQFGFLLDGEQKINTSLFTGTQDIKDNYKNSDVAISIGGGWDFPFGLSADVRYNIGVKDINNAANGEETKSRVFLVSLGWNFLK
jgi:Outer membrane protein beta-barrel domain